MSDDVLQQLSWGFRVFNVLARTRFDTLSFRCWVRDKINSCHPFRIDAEMCGLAGNLSYHDTQEIFSSKTILWVFIWVFMVSFHFFLHSLCTVCVVACVGLGVMCVCVFSIPRYAGRHTDQTNLSREMCGGTSMWKPDPLFAREAKQAMLTIHSDVIWENLSSDSGGGGGGGGGGMGGVCCCSAWVRYPNHTQRGLDVKQQNWDFASNTILFISSVILGEWRVT